MGEGGGHEGPDRETETPALDDVLARIEGEVSARLSSDEVIAEIERGRRRD
ncbi:hypothetical protein ACIBCB_07700 [Streptomyces uncialis]|uniref:hypothetical protein n=1 Tax=Streptomyces uncialis TaxID=1048205 RepID=UPI0037A2EA7D